MGTYHNTWWRLTNRLWNKLSDIVNTDSVLAQVFTLSLYTSFPVLWLHSSEGYVNAHLTSVILSTESETSNNTGVSETQPSGDFYGDSKDFSLTDAMCHQNIPIHGKLFLNIDICPMQQSSWEIFLLWRPWKPSWQPWHHMPIFHPTTFASSRTSRQARTGALPLYSCPLLW